MALDNNYNGLTKLKDWWGKVKANFTYLDNRISTIITTPAEGVSAQEIIDARKGELALGDKIDALDLADSELFNKIGNLSNLTTIEKTNLVGAVSEVKNEVTSHEADLASQELNKGASLIGIHDADALFTATDVEGALAELFTSGNDGKNLLETTLIAKNATVSKAGDVITFAELNSAINTLPSIAADNYFYNEGDECTDLTGGWSASNDGVGSLTKNADNIEFSSGATTSTKSYGTVNKIDVTSLSKIYIDWEGTTSRPGVTSNAFWLSSLRSRSGHVATVYGEGNFSRMVTELNVSSITGSYYLMIGRGSSEAADTVTSKMYRIWGE